MTDAEVFLVPLGIMLALGALGPAWQARHPLREIAARQVIVERDAQRYGWNRMRKWRSYCACQDAPARFAQSASLRARMLGLAAMAVAVVLVL